MLGDILTALTQPAIVVGALVALMIIGALLLLNLHFDWLMSTKRHRELKDVMQSRVEEAQADGDRAHADADAKIITMREAMDKRSLELRADIQDRVAQVRADSQAELDRLLKVVEAVQREVESWRQAFHIADAANTEEAEARWAQIQSALAVLERFVTEVVHRQVASVRELESGRDGGGSVNVR